MPSHPTDLDGAAVEEWRDAWLGHPQAQEQHRKLEHRITVGGHVVTFCWSRGAESIEISGWGGDYPDALEAAVRLMRREA